MKAVVFGKFRSVITVGLMLWCAGAGCMIVSYAHGAAMSAANTGGVSCGSTSGETSGSMGRHDCCKARHKSERRAASSMMDHASSSEFLANLEGLAEVLNSSNAMSCCPLTSGSIVANGSSSRISNDDASESLGLDAASSVRNGFATMLPANSLRLTNQSHTYLRGCAFLI